MLFSRSSSSLCFLYAFMQFTEDPELARTVYFIHMRKAAGTAVRQFFRTIYHRKSCLPLKERKLVHSDQDNWR
jgi:hypothetical protein